MSKSFFDIAGSFYLDYRKEAQCALQSNDDSQSLEDLYDVTIWHCDTGSYVSIDNRVSPEKQQAVDITTEQALVLLEFLEGQRERLQELCNINKGN